MGCQANEHGVSVIVGTLLLILITVTAAAGLALMVSQMQKDEMNRQSHLAAVKNERIEIAGIQLEDNQTDWNQSLSGSYFPLPSPPWTPLPYYSSIRLNLMNLNTDETRILGIAINGHYAASLTTVSDTPPLDVKEYNVTAGEYLTLPGTKSQLVRINFTSDFPSGLNITSDTPINVKLITSMYNTFEKTFKQPNAVIQTKIESDDIGTIQRDALILDGSQSTADATILSYNWTIYDLAFTSPPGNLPDRNNWFVHNQTYSGKTVRTSELNNTPYYRVSLTVSDALGLSATSSSPVSIPPGQFSPPIYLNLRLDRIGESTNVTSSYLNATLRDINNKFQTEAPVTFIIRNDPNTVTRCFSLNSTATYTDNSANATVIASQRWVTAPCDAVTIYAVSGKLISQDVIIPGVAIH